MKNLFSIPSDASYKEKCFYEKYLSQTISKKTESEILLMNQKISELQSKHKSTLKIVSKVISLLSALSLMIGLYLILKNNLHIAGLCLIVLCIILFILSLLFNHLQYKKDKDFSTSKEVTEINTEAISLIKRAYKELNIEENPTEVDICLYYYRYDKNGNQINHFPYNAYFLKEYALQKSGAYLLIADIYGVIKIPLSAIKGLQKSESVLHFGGWNKNVPMTDPMFKDYKIKPLKENIFKMNGFYRLSLELEGEDIEIIFPKYEKEKIELFFKDIHK